MLEVSLAGKDHWNAMLVTGRDNFVVLPRTPRLNDRDNPSLSRSVNGIGKRKKCIRGQYAPLGLLSCLFDRNFNAVNSAHLTCTDTNQRSIAS